MMAPAIHADLRIEPPTLGAQRMAPAVLVACTYIACRNSDAKVPG
jgi:hypothetical protein